MEFVSTDCMIGQTLSEDILNEPVNYYLGEVDMESEFDPDDEDEEDYHAKKPKKQIG